MKHSKRAILKALRIIKSVCNGTSCENCPLAGNVNGLTQCLLRTAPPIGWAINDKCKAWKAIIVGDSDD